MTAPTVLHAKADEWERLLSGQSDSPPEAPALRAAWERLRSRALSLDCLPEINGADLIRRAAPLRPTLDLLDSLVDSLGEQLPLDHRRAVFTDADAVILWACGGALAREAPALELLRPGVSCEEALVGPNAMGTAAALRAVVVVEGDAHVLRPFRSITCCAAPVFGPSGELRGVVNVSGPREMDTETALCFATRLAGLIAGSLHRRQEDRALNAQLEMALALVDRTVEPALLIEAPRAHGAATVTRANAAAATLLPTWLRAASADRASPAQRPAVAEAPPSTADRPALPPAEADHSLWQNIVQHVESGDLHAELLGHPTQIYPLYVSAGALAAALLIAHPQQRAAAPGAQAPPVDPAVESAREAALRLAPGAMPLLIVGERGTGRRRLAREIHTLSGRRGLHLIDCQATPWLDLELQLFGAGRRSTAGLLRLTTPDTIVLHEICELPAPLQARILRWLSETRVLVSGGRAPRLICTAHPSIKDHVAVGSFRMDLFAALAPRLLSLPALDRRADKAALVRALLNEIAVNERLPSLQIAPDLLPLIESLLWPGNISELRAALTAAARRASPHPVAAQHLSLHPTPPAPPALPRGGLDLDTLTEKAIRDALVSAGGNVSAAAKHLGVARSTMYRMLERYGLR